jgi:hypothetical protein
MNNKQNIMTFDAFAKETELQDPKTAMKGDNVDSQKKEKFVDQVKRADLTGLAVNQPDYSKTKDKPINEDVNPVQAELDALVPKIQSATEDLKKAQNALNDLHIRQAQLQQQSAATTATTTVAPVPATQPVQPTPVAQAPSASPAV